MNFEKTDVMFVVEKSKTFKKFLPELMESYLSPTLTYFSGGICEETDVFFKQCSLVRYGVVFFGSGLSLLSSRSQLDALGPTTSQNSIVKAINEAQYTSSNTTRQAYIMEGLESATNVFKKLPCLNKNESVKRCLVLVTQSAPMLHPWSGSYDNILQELKMLGVKTSIISAHKIQELYKLFEDAGGDLPSISHKNYATKPTHMVLLNGFSLQERALSPSLANQPSLVNTGFHTRPTSSPTHVGSPMGNQPQQTVLQQNLQPHMAPRSVQPNQMMVQNTMNAMNPMQQNQRPKWPMGAVQMNQQNQPQQQMAMQQQTQQMQNQNPQMGQVPNMQQLPVMNNSAAMNQPQSRAAPQTIWQGQIEWTEKTTLLRLPCKITSLNGKSEIKTEGWPATLNMFLVQKELLSAVGNTHFLNNNKVMFLPDQCPALESLTNSLTKGQQAGCVHLSSANTEVKIIVLLFSSDKKAFVGFIPIDQGAFVTKINQVFQSQNKPRIPNAPNMPIHQGNFKQNVGGNMIQNMSGNQGVQNQNMQIIPNQGMNVNQGNIMMSSQMSQQMSQGMNTSNPMVNSGVNQVGNNQMNQIGGMSQNQGMNMGPNGGQMGMAGHVNQGQMGSSQSVLTNQLMQPTMSMNQQQPDSLNGRPTLQHQGNIRQMQRPSLQMNMNQPRMIQSQMQTQNLRQILHQRLQQQQQQQQILMMQQQQGMRPQMGQTQQVMTQQSMGQQAMSQQQQMNQQQSMGQPLQDDTTDYLNML